MSKRQVSMAVVTVGLLAAAFIMYAARGAIAGGFSGLKLSPSPDGYTELYFADPNSLPGQIAASQPLAFSFTIHNLEGATTTYPYESYFENSSGTRTLLASGSVTIPNNTAATVKVSHNFPSSGMQGAAIVVLPTKNGQSIDFLLR